MGYPMGYPMGYSMGYSMGYPMGYKWVTPLSFPSGWLRDITHRRVRSYISGGDQHAPPLRISQVSYSKLYITHARRGSEGLGGSFRLSRGVVAQEFWS